MENQINKTFEYELRIVDIDHTIRVSLTSMHKDLDIKNINWNNEHVYSVEVNASPTLPDEVFNDFVELIFMIDGDKNYKIGHLSDMTFTELDNTLFLDGLCVKILTVLTETNEITGHYKFDFP